MLTWHTEIWSKNAAHEEAAWSFIKANKHKKAAAEYHELGRHEQVLATYFHGGQYNELAIYLKQYGFYGIFFRR